MPFHTIDIIGGTDGPTAIFVSCRPSVWELAIAGGILAAAVVGIILFIRKKKKR